MTGTVRHWAAGLALSLGLHGAVATALLAALAPEPPPPQAADQAALALQSYRVERTAARPAEPPSQPTSPSAPDAAPARVQGIPTGRAMPVGIEPTALPALIDPAPLAAATAGPVATAEAVAPGGQALSAATAPAQSIATSEPRPQVLRGTERPAGPTLTATPMQTATLAPAQAEPRVVATATPVALALDTALPPDTRADPVPAEPAPLSTLVATGAVAPAQQAAALFLLAASPPPQSLAASPGRVATSPAVAPPATVSAALPPPARPAPATPPDPLRMTAALSLPGAEALSDPQSVAALQSFLAPEAAPGGDAVRDGLEAALSAVPCARVHARFDPEATALVLTGHVPRPEDAAPMVAALQAQVGADIAVLGDLRVLPPPQCQALTAMARAGLPQSTDQITNPLMVGPDTHARAYDYAEGDQLLLDIEAPDYDAYVYVDYFDSAGRVIHLTPNEFVPLFLSSAQAPLRIGAESPDDPGLFITITPPFGQEIAVAFATSVPLFDEIRPLFEPAAPYLDLLRERVARARAETPDFKGEWAYFFVTTGPAAR